MQSPYPYSPEDERAGEYDLVESFLPGVFSSGLGSPLPPGEAPAEHGAVAAFPAGASSARALTVVVRPSLEIFSHRTWRLPIWLTLRGHNEFIVVRSSNPNSINDRVIVTSSRNDLQVPTFEPVGKVTTNNWKAEERPLTKNEKRKLERVPNICFCSKRNSTDWSPVILCFSWSMLPGYTHEVLAVMTEHLSDIAERMSEMLSAALRETAARTNKSEVDLARCLYESDAVALWMEEGLCEGRKNEVPKPLEEVPNTSPQEVQQKEAWNNLFESQLHILTRRLTRESFLQHWTLFSDVHQIRRAGLLRLKRNTKLSLFMTESEGRDYLLKHPSAKWLLLLEPTRTHARKHFRPIVQLKQGGHKTIFRYRAKKTKNKNKRMRNKQYFADDEYKLNHLLKEQADEEGEIEPLQQGSSSSSSASSPLGSIAPATMEEQVFQFQLQPQQQQEH